MKLGPSKSASEVIGHHHNHAKFMATGVHVTRMAISRNPFHSESAFLFEALPPTCLLETADLSVLCVQDMKECFMCTGHEGVLHIDTNVVMCAKRKVNIHILCFLSPEGGMKGGGK